MRDFDEALKGRNNLVGAEIGVFKGEHALMMLDGLDIKKLYLVDSYSRYPQYSGVDLSIWEKLVHAEKEAKTLIKKKGLTKKVKWMIKKSMKAVQEFKDESLDFVYIDANHNYRFVRDDIVHWTPKVKKGGLVGGHDYFLNKFNRGVKRAVDEFAADNKIDLIVKGADWFFWKQ